MFAERLGSPMISIFLVGVWPVRSCQYCEWTTYGWLRQGGLKLCVKRIENSPDGGGAIARGILVSADVFE